MRRALALLALLAAPASGQGLPGPAATQAENRATLEYFAPPAGPALIFKLGPPPAPPAEEQGRILDRLLGRLIAERPDLPAVFQVRLGDSRAALVEAMDRDLLAPGANWDAARGRPRRGRLGAALTAALNRVLPASPIGAAFAAHGYKLRADGVGRISLARRNGGLAPASVDVINLTATRNRSPGDPP